MAVTLAGNPGDLPAWESQRYAAVVNDVAALVYARSQDMHLDSDSPYLTIDIPSEQSQLKFTYNEAVTIVIAHNDAGDPIESASIYPERDDVTLTVAGGEVTLVLPVDAVGIDLWLETNGDRQNVLHISAQPPLDGVLTLDGNGDPATTDWTTIGPKTISSIDTGANEITTASAHGWSVGQKVHYYSTGTYPTAVGGDLDDLTIYYVQSVSAANKATLSRTSGGAVIDLTGSGSGTQTLIQASYSDSASALYFGPGEHRIGMLFAVGDDVEVYLDYGAVVIGSIDWRGTDGSFLHGPGVMSGTFADPQVGQPFGDLIPYSMFYGYDGSKFYFDNRIEGITIIAQPGFVNFYGLWSMRYVQMICPWEANTDGAGLRSRTSTNQVSEIYRCYCYLGDDALHIDTGAGVTTVDKSFFICSANGSPFLLSYTYDLITDLNGTTWDVQVTDCHAMTLAGPDPDTYDEWPYRGFTSIFKAWIDAPTDRTVKGRFGVTFDGVDVWGPLQSRMVAFANLPYDFVGTADGKGQVYDVTFRNITVHEEPGQPSTLESLDWVNTPHDISFWNLRVADTLVTTRNYGDYFRSFGPYLYRIAFGGRTVTTAVDICNAALSHVGERDRVTSIEPPDGSEEARQCVRAYTQAFEELMEMHNWSFNTKKIQLTQINTDSDDTDDPAWPYRYEVPEGMAEALAVLPEEHEDDYVVGSAKQPQDFHIKQSTDDEELRIYTKWSAAWLRYTVYLDDPNQLSKLAVSALEWLVASKLAGTIVRGDAGKAMERDCLAMFGKYLAEAKLKDAKQRQVSAEVDPPWLAGRTVPRNPWNRSLVSE